MTGWMSGPLERDEAAEQAAWERRWPAVKPSYRPRNAFTVERWRWNTTDLAVPVIDSVPLFEILGTDWPGLDARLVLAPSLQWLGSPDYREYGGTVVLDGSCGIAGCCGVIFRISLFADTVVWDQPYCHGEVDIPEDLRFEFDRAEYEAQLRALADVPVVDHTTS